MYIYIDGFDIKMVGWLMFYVISTLVGYLMQNILSLSLSIYIYIYIYRERERERERKRERESDWKRLGGQERIRKIEKKDERNAK